MKFLIEKLNKKGEVENSEELIAYDHLEAVRVVLDRSNLRITVVEEEPKEEAIPQPKVESLPYTPKGGEKNGKNTND